MWTHNFLAVPGGDFHIHVCSIHVSDLFDLFYEISDEYIIYLCNLSCDPYIYKAGYCINSRNITFLFKS